MANSDAIRVGDRDADLGVRAGGGECREVAAKVRVENTEPVAFAGSVCEAKQGGQRKNQVRQDRAGSRRCAFRLVATPRSAATRAISARRHGTIGVSVAWVPSVLVSVVRVIVAEIRGGFGVWCRLRVRGVGA
jgi:hypothetical protein